MMQKALEEANDVKLQGNKLFADKRYDEALLKYDLALQLSSHIPSAAELRANCYYNRGTCFVKMVNGPIKFMKSYIVKMMCWRLENRDHQIRSTPEYKIILYYLFLVLIYVRESMRSRSKNAQKR